MPKQQLDEQRSQQRAAAKGFCQDLVHGVQACIADGRGQRQQDLIVMRPRMGALVHSFCGYMGGNGVGVWAAHVDALAIHVPPTVQADVGDQRLQSVLPGVGFGVGLEQQAPHQLALQNKVGGQVSQQPQHGLRSEDIGRAQGCLVQG